MPVLVISAVIVRDKPLPLILVIAISKLTSAAGCVAVGAGALVVVGGVVGGGWVGGGVGDGEGAGDGDDEGGWLSGRSLLKENELRKFTPAATITTRAMTAKIMPIIANFISFFPQI